LAFPFEPWPPPDRDPSRRRLELPRVPFFVPVPDAPGRLPLFFAPLDRCPDTPRPRGASGFAPLPFVPRELCLRAMPNSSAATLANGIPRIAGGAVNPSEPRQEN